MQSKTESKTLFGFVTTIVATLSALTVMTSLAYADEGLSDSVDVFLNAEESSFNGDSLGTAYFHAENPNNLPNMPAIFWAYVQANNTYTTINSVQMVLGGQVEIDPPQIVNEIQVVDTILPDLFFNEYMGVLDLGLLDFQPIANGVSATDVVRAVVTASTTYGRIVPDIAELAELPITLDVLDLSIVDTDRNLIPDSSALLDVQESDTQVLIGAGGNVTLVQSLVLAGDAGAFYGFPFESSFGWIQIRVFAPALYEMQAADPSFSQYTRAVTITSISTNAASLLDGPGTVNPANEFDGDVTLGPDDIFVRVNVAVSNGTSFWTFLDTLPGGLEIIVEFSGPGLDDILSTLPDLAAHSYSVTLNRNGENISAIGDQNGWDPVSISVVPYRRGGLSDPVVELSSNNVSAIFSSNAFRLDATPGSSPGGGGGGGGGGGCFIATAAYGTPLASELDSLRGFRDQYLLRDTLGAAFTDTYYRVSPFVARKVAQHEVLRQVVRTSLAPINWLIRSDVSVLLAIGVVVIALIVFPRGALVLRRRRYF